MMLTRELGYSDKKLPRGLVYGMGISGKIEAANSLARRQTPASTNMETIKHHLDERNRNIIEDLSRTRDQTLKQKRWGLSIEEFHKMRLSEPIPITDYDREIRPSRLGSAYLNNTVYSRRNIAS